MGWSYDSDGDSCYYSSDDCMSEYSEPDYYHKDLQPSDIKFSQDSCGDRFSCGRLLEDVVDDIYYEYSFQFTNENSVKYNI